MKKFKDFILQDYKLRYFQNSKRGLLWYYCFSPSFKIICWYRICQYLENGVRLFLNLYLARLNNEYAIHLEATHRIGPGLRFPHNGPCQINPGAIIGSFCTIEPGVLIGGNRPKGSPIIGDHVYIGNGAKIIGAIEIGDFTYIEAGAIITKDVPSGARMGLGLNNLVGYDGQKLVLEEENENNI